MSQLHVDELTVSTVLVRQLVDQNFPEYADVELTPMQHSGSSNILFRLGEDKAVRLPRQPGGGTTIVKEASWLPYVASHVTAQVPSVVAIGETAPDYPERWAITTWLDGVRPTVGQAASRHGGTTRLGRDLARFLTELRSMPIPESATSDEALISYRGLPLGDLDTAFRESASECRELAIGLDIDRALRVWDLAVDASGRVSSTTAWYHGDLVAENLLLGHDGGLAAVVDFGGLGVGDPTVDLVVAWEALADDGRAVFKRELGVDDVTWTVSRGWALLIAMMTFSYYATSMPGRCAERLVMARAAIDGH